MAKAVASPSTRRCRTHGTRPLSHFRFDGSGWYCRQKRAAAWGRYDRSQKGKKRFRRYESTQAGRARQIAYDMTEKGRARFVVHKMGQKGAATELLRRFKKAVRGA